MIKQFKTGDKVTLVQDAYVDDQLGDLTHPAVQAFVKYGEIGVVKFADKQDTEVVFSGQTELFYMTGFRHDLSGHFKLVEDPKSDVMLKAEELTRQAEELFAKAKELKASS